MKSSVKLACKQLFMAVFTSEESPMILVRSQNVQEYAPRTDILLLSYLYLPRSRDTNTNTKAPNSTIRTPMRPM